MNKIQYHIIFWIFISLYVFDYLIFFYDFKDSILYTSFEILVLSSEFYINLFILLPFVLIKKGRIAYIISLVVLLFLGFSAYYLTGLNTVLYSKEFQRSVISFVLNHSLYIFISYIIWFVNKYFNEKQMRLQLENEKLQSEMMMLKSQISPHFLFNALNNIYSLTLIKSENAPKMLATLADILRYFLYDTDKKTTFLTSEIEIINKYIQIQKYRQIAGMNNINFNISNDNLALQVPPLLLITLVENAFKHGDIIENKDGFVTIDLVTINNKIEFVIANSFQHKGSSEGIGLTNLKSQLKNIFKDNYHFSIDDNNMVYKVTLSFYGS